MRNAVVEEKENSRYHLLTLRFLDSSLRLSAIPLCVASIWVTLTNKQINSVYGNLDFKSFSGLKYLIFINTICACYAFVALIFSWVRGRISDWVFFLSDQVIAYLMVTSGSAVIETLYLAYKGDKGVTWSEGCSTYGKFCSTVKVSLLLHLVALFCFLILSLISAFRIFTKFGPPYIPPKDGEEGVE